MRRFLAYVALVGLIACGDSDRPRDLPSPADSVADSVPDAPGKSEEAPGQQKKEVEPAQLACVPSLSVNGQSFEAGANVFTVETLPRSLEIDLVDCPNPTAVVRDNFVRTGAGSGELHVVLLKRGAIQRGVNRLGSDRVELGSEGHSLFSGHKIYRTDSNRAIIKYITRPGGWGFPEEITGVATTPAVAKVKVAVRSKTRQPDQSAVQIEIRMYDSTIREQGRVGTRSIVIREACSAEAQASASRFDC